MFNDRLTKRLALGAVAGLAGTLAIQILLKTRQKYSPESMPPIREEPGHFMLRKAKRALPKKVRHRVPEKAEEIGSKMLGAGYGMTFGALYAAARPKTKCAVLEGTLLGIAAWTVGYLGWLPGAGLMRPIWKQRLTQAAIPVAEHAVFGLATVAGYRWLTDRA